MSVTSVKKYLEDFGCQKKVQIFSSSSATVPLAALALKTECRNIAKTMVFLNEDICFVVVLAGDVKIDNHKFKEVFHTKAKMVQGEEVERKTNHPVGGVCPFALPTDVDVYLDVSLQRMDLVYPACGSASSAIGLSLPELEKYSHAKTWVDVSKLIE